MAAAAIAVVAVAMSPGLASAQEDYPPTSPTTTPPACTVTVAFSGPALPNITVNVTLGCSSIEAGRTYTGSLASTPVALPATTATADGTITFTGVRLPADWETNATHTATLVDQATGRSLGTASFFVDRTGRITAPPSGGIPRTGSDYVEPALQIGAALLAAGTAAVVVARRRRASAVAA